MDKFDFIGLVNTYSELQAEAKERTQLFEDIMYYTEELFNFLLNSEFTDTQVEAILKGIENEEDGEDIWNTLVTEYDYD